MPPPPGAGWLADGFEKKRIGDLSEIACFLLSVSWFSGLSKFVDVVFFVTQYLAWFREVHNGHCFFGSFKLRTVPQGPTKGKTRFEQSPNNENFFDVLAAFDDGPRMLEINFFL